MDQALKELAEKLDEVLELAKESKNYYLVGRLASLLEEMTRAPYNDND